MYIDMVTYPNSDVYDEYTVPWLLAKVHHNLFQRSSFQIRSNVTSRLKISQERQCFNLLVKY